MLINCIIVEDEPLAMERLKQYVTKTPILHLQATFDNGMDAWVYIRSQQVDLIFLDINMGELSGIQLLESADISSQVIFTTAYQEYALKGFDLKVTDYLLKPFTFERFLQAVGRVGFNISKSIQAEPFIFIKTENRLEKIILGDIIYIEGMRDYRKIHTTTRKIMTLKTFTEFEQEISPSIICRIHKSYMVNTARINAVEKDKVTIADTVLPVSETYKKILLDQLKDKG